jgi:hypothetical protein
LYSAPNNIKKLKSKKIKLEGDVERVGKKRNACRVWVGRSENKKSFRKPYVDLRLIL